MRITSSTRRNAALLAASTVGLSTLVLGVTGVAGAVPIVLEPSPITSEDDYSVSSDDPATSVSIENGFCTAFIQVDGGEGGADSSNHTGPADEVHAVIPVHGGQVFSFHVGTAGDLDTPGTNADVPAANGHTGPADEGAGGAGSSLTLNGGGVVASAKGGHGGVGDGGAGGGTSTFDAAHYTLDNGGTDLFSGSTADDGASGWSGDGQIYVHVMACDAPYAPYIYDVEAQDTSATVTFYPEDGDQTTAAPNGYEYTLDGGDTWTSTSTTTSSSDPAAEEFTLTGLTTGQAYSVQLRATSQYNGRGDASEATSFTPVHIAAAPSNVHATVGTSSVHITWDAPVGETGITGYSAWVLPGPDPQSDSGLVECPALDANARECTIAVPAGTVYTASVVALNPDPGYWGSVVTDVVPAPEAPTTVPTANGPLDTPSGAPSGLAQGSSVTLTGSGYAPNSTVSVYIYSTPTLLGTAVTDGTGAFSKAFTIPTTLAPGSHHLVAAGIDVNGNPRYLVSAVTVAQASGSLAWTGFETLPVLGAGVVLVGLGGGLVVTARRRRTAA